jgi:hypothetical protein
LLQARGVRWAIIVAGLVSFLADIRHWFIAKA